MAKPIGYWGIDIGQCALKAIRIELVDGKPTATAYDYIEHPKILSQPDADPDALTREALEKFLSRNPVGKDHVVIGIAGQSGLARFVKLPPVEEKKVAEIVKFEAKQQIPFPLDEVVWDYQKIGGGEAVGGFAMETEIGLFAMKRDVIAKHLAYYQAVNCDVHMVQMAPLALCNYATYDVLQKGGPDGFTGDGIPPDEKSESPRGKKRCAVILDIGTDSSNLIITDAGKIIWQRPLPLGGSHFTKALVKEMKLTFAKAEHLKRNAAKSADLASILRALRPVLTDFVGEVQRSLGYFTNTHRDAHVAYMVGLGNAFRLPGLQKYLAEKLSLDVRKPSKVNRLYGDSVLNDSNFQENVLTFPIAIGLALQGVGLARLTTNLLPTEIRTERLIRAKKPYAAAAAAALLLGSGAIAFGFSAQYKAVTDPKIKSAIDKSKSAVSAHKAQEALIATKAGEVAGTQAEVKTIISGNDERLNWIRLQEVLLAALPRHGDNLNDPSQTEFWSSAEGARAYEKYKQRLSEGIPLEKMFDDDMSQHLANVNVEGVYCRYTDNLATFLANADSFADKRFGINIAADMLPAEQEEDTSVTPPRKKPKAVEGGGWVVEVRGYTYHQSAENFLKKTLLANLQKFDRFATETPGGKVVPKVIPNGSDPIKGKVSNVFMLLAQRDPNPAPSAFKYSDQLWVDAVSLGMLNAAAGGPGSDGDGPPIPPTTPPGVPPGTPGVPGAPGATPSPGASWKPVFGLSSPPPAVATGAAGGKAGPGVGPFVPLPPAVGEKGALDPKVKVKPRTEFVVCFVWREPTPTDTGAAAGPATGGTTPSPTGGRAFGE